MKTMPSISKDELIALLQRAAHANGGRPPGERAFYSDNRLRKKDLWDAGIRSYGDLCELAGHARNRFLQKPMEPDQLFEPLAVLTAQIGRFPDYTDREMARRKDASFPGYKAYRTARENNGPLAQQRLEWCRSRPRHSQAQQIIEEHLSQEGGRAQRVRRQRVVTGYVYLMRYGGRGRKYKIGKSEDPPRRHSQLFGMVPDELSIVHVIETDDPSGIERYWHERFRENRIANKKEVFHLEASDVAAFKSRTYQ